MMFSDSNKSKAYVRFKARNAANMQRLPKETHLNAQEVYCCSVIYFELLYDGDPRAEFITRPQFLHVLNYVFDMRDVYLVNRVMQCLDRGITANVTLETWVRAISLFVRGTLDERMEFCFSVYNVHQTESLSRESLVFLLRNTLGKHRPAEELDEQCIEMSDFLMKRMDRDLDGYINYADYSQVVRERPNLLEVLGQCLPERGALPAFVSTFSVIGGGGGGGDDAGADSSTPTTVRSKVPPPRPGTGVAVDAACAERIRLALKMTPSDIAERLQQRERARRERAQADRTERLRVARTTKYLGVAGLEQARKIKTAN